MDTYQTVYRCEGALLLGTQFTSSHLTQELLQEQYDTLLGQVVQFVNAAEEQWNIVSGHHSAAIIQPQLTFIPTATINAGMHVYLCSYPVNIKMYTMMFRYVYSFSAHSVHLHYTLTPSTHQCQSWLGNYT